jgi:glycosyltransferase involved in cell wall biosynthesis
LKVWLIDPSLYTPPYDSALAEALIDAGLSVRLFGRPRRASDAGVSHRVELVEHFYRASERQHRGGPTPLHLRLTKGVEHIGDALRLASRARSEQPDIVHWQWPSVPLVDLVAAKQLTTVCPQVITVHDANLFHKHGLARLYTSGWQRFLRASDALVVHVDSTRAHLERDGVTHPCIVKIPHGVFEPVPRQSGAFDGTRPLRLLFAGRLSVDKGFDLLCEAYARVADRLAGKVELRIVGSPSPEQLIAAALRQIEAQPGVELTARFVSDDEFNAAYAWADVGVFPHREVDASGAMMRALSFDLGLLASDIPSFQEVLGEDSSLMFSAGSVDGLIARLIELAENPAMVDGLRSRAKRLVHSSLAWSLVAEQTKALYTRLLAERGGHRRAR